MKIKLRSGKEAEVETAEGTKGYLLRGPNNIWFRVYDEDHGFKDYEIYHYDLEITITDKHARFYELEDGKRIIDYSPEALGYKDEEK